MLLIIFILFNSFLSYFYLIILGYLYFVDYFLFYSSIYLSCHFYFIVFSLLFLFYIIINSLDGKKCRVDKLPALWVYSWICSYYKSTHWGGRREMLLFWPPVCPWMNWSCTVICSLSISWWDHNASITFVVACGLPRLVLSYRLFSHHWIPQARWMCSVCPKNGTNCSSLCVKTPVLEGVWVSERLGEVLRGLSMFDRL